MTALPRRRDASVSVRRFHALHRELEIAVAARPMMLTPGTYAGSLADDALAATVRQGFAGLTDARLAELHAHAKLNGVVPAHVWRQAVVNEQARRRAYPIRAVRLAREMANGDGR